MSLAFIRLRRRAGIRELPLHSLRHFAATRMLDAGVPVRTVAGRLGHANAATTLNVYSHWVVALDQAAAVAWETFYDGQADSTGKRGLCSIPLPLKSPRNKEMHRRSQGDIAGHPTEPASIVAMRATGAGG